MCSAPKQGPGSSKPLITTGKLTRDELQGQVAVVTGAGRGIGFEAARSLAYLGAKVVIAEIDAASCNAAADTINREIGKMVVMACETDVGDEASVQRLVTRVAAEWSPIDIVLNNATVTPFGPVDQVEIAAWDQSYAVNLRGPVLLARACLPGMKARKSGVIVCVTSVGEAFMGPYESLKAAQAHLARVLDAELQGTGVWAFAIGPGLVRTPGADAAIPHIAKLYGKTEQEFYAMSRDHEISAEAAGAGFAAAIAMAERFAGQETSSKHALTLAGISIDGDAHPPGQDARGALFLSGPTAAEAAQLCRTVRGVLADQSAGWQKRSLFERQWMLRDFRRHAGLAVADWLNVLDCLLAALDSGKPVDKILDEAPLHRLAGYFGHYLDLATGYIRDPVMLAEQTAIIDGWRSDADRLTKLLYGGSQRADQ